MQILIFTNIISLATFLFLVILGQIITLGILIPCLVIISIDIFFRIVIFRNLLIETFSGDKGILKLLTALFHWRTGGQVLFIPQWVLGIGFWLLSEI